MKRIGRTILGGLLATTLLGGSGAAQQSPAQAQKTLYQRLGGYDAIAAVSDEFLGRLLTDQAFTRFFVGFSNDSKARIRQNVVDFFCAKAGGPCVYLGRDMKTSHAGIGVTKAEWDRAVQLFIETLTKLNVGNQEQKDLAAVVGPLEKDIVEKP